MQPQQQSQPGPTSDARLDISQHLVSTADHQLPRDTTDDEPTEAIPRQELLGSYETSHKDIGKKSLSWCITSVTFSVFYIATARFREVLKKLVGKDLTGYLNFGYFSFSRSFAWNFRIKAQYCWTHFIREMRFLPEKRPDKKTKPWAEQLVDRSRRLFSARYRR